MSIGNPVSRKEISSYFKQVQDEYCTALEAADGSARFNEHNWNRKGGGGGRTRVIEDGAVIEKGGVNFSAVWGELPSGVRRILEETDKEQVIETTFFATGISLVIHPVSPIVPIIHLNFRYFELGDKKELEQDSKSTTTKCWFGGGIDLTPHYVDKTDARYFHRSLKTVCDRFDPGYYPRFKSWADDYFFIEHRQETRGIGGVFFDRLGSNGHSSNGAAELIETYEFVKAMAAIFIPTYNELVNRSKDKPFGDREREWQLLRRGRYVEFNLVYDRGTKFGLETNGRVESILMSLPKIAGWQYDSVPEANSKEQQTLDLLRKGIDWAG